MLWLALLSPLAALTFLMVMERFEQWMLAATPARPAAPPVEGDAAEEPARAGDPCGAASARAARTHPSELVNGDERTDPL